MSFSKKMEVVICNSYCILMALLGVIFIISKVFGANEILNISLIGTILLSIIYFGYVIISLFIEEVKRSITLELSLRYIEEINRRKKMIITL